MMRPHLDGVSRIHDGITLGTVDYGETRPLDTTGRALTIGVIIIEFTTV